MAIDIPSFAPPPSPDEIARVLESRGRKVSKSHGNNGTAIALAGFQSDKKLDRTVDAKFEETVVQRMRLYNCDALDALHDLAMMPITKNSSQMHIKYLAACRLAGAPADGNKSPDLSTTLASLNERFHKDAVRIKGIRETVREVTFEDQPGAILDERPQ